MVVGRDPTDTSLVIHDGGMVEGIQVHKVTAVTGSESKPVTSQSQAMHESTTLGTVCAGYDWSLLTHSAG
jgi:hypothetical protein